MTKAGVGEVERAMAMTKVKDKSVISNIGNDKALTKGMPKALKLMFDTTFLPYSYN